MLAAALALCFLIFTITVASLARTAASYARVSSRHAQTSALFVAEAGIAKAAASLAADRDYQGETGTRIATGAFDVAVTASFGGYTLTSTGHAASPLKNGARKTVEARVTIRGAQAVISDWRQDP